jgi:hypothetical protein
MFYEESVIEDSLKCVYCNKRLVEPKTIPCGEVLCKNCLEELINESNCKRKFKRLKCCYCNKEHYIPTSGFLSSKHIEKLLMAKPQEIYRSQKTEKLKEYLTNIKNDVEEIDHSLVNGETEIKEKCKIIKNEMETKVESTVEQLNEFSKQFKSEIEAYELECIESFRKSADLRKGLKRKLTDQSEFYLAAKKYLCQAEIDENEIKKYTEYAKQHVNENLIIRNNLRQLMFTNRYVDFAANEQKLDSTLVGWLRNNSLSGNL